MLRGRLATPGYRAVLRVMRDALDPAFVAMIDTLIEEVRDRPPTDPISEWRAAVARELAIESIKPGTLGD
jgi:hypothetical protein